MALEARRKSGQKDPSKDGPERSGLISPLVKWAGGKSWQIPLIRPMWTPYRRRRYVEPFAGGLAMAFALAPLKALVNDSNEHLMNLYLRVSEGVGWTCHTPDVVMQHTSKRFYQNRARFNKISTLKKQFIRSAAEADEAAMLFYYLNRSCFNGLCRFNRSGEFNVPFGRYKTVNYDTITPQHGLLLAKWQLRSGDFELLVLEKGDFIYADPPYDGGFSDFSKEGFSWEDQVRCAEWIAAHKGPAVLVNLATPRIVKLYRALKFNVQYVQGPRRISSAGGRTPEREILATRGL